MDRIVGIVILLFSMGILWQGRRLLMGTLREPGPGFFPNLVAVLMIILSLFLIIFKGKGESDGNPFIPGATARIVIILAALVIYSFILEPLGFLVSSFLLMACLFKAYGNERWPMAILYSLIGVVASYVLFEIVLKGNFPKGVIPI